MSKIFVSGLVISLFAIACLFNARKSEDMLSTWVCSAVLLLIGIVMMMDSNIAQVLP